MVQARLMARIVLVAGLVASISFAPADGNDRTPVVPHDGFTRGPECDSTETCASALLAREEVGWTPHVEGRYTVVSAAVLMPGTGHAIRVIEFSPASADEDDGWTPESQEVAP
jgi:hypothetical protein